MKRKILVVDDNQEYIKIAIGYIIEESVPYAMLAAHNGAFALEIAKKELPDIIILDWEMPEMDGIETVKALRSYEPTSDIPVIISTGIRVTSEDLKIALDAGASDFIRKPVDKSEFMARISAHIKMADHLKTIKRQKEDLKHAELTQLEHTISTLNHQLETVNMQMNTFGTYLQGIKEQLQCVSNNLVCDHKVPDKLEKIISSIQVSSYLENRIQQSDSRMVNCGFINKMLHRHKNLTPNEIQLCFLLKQNLSSKEIAELSFHTVNSVKVSRSRLRKKLNLHEKENITLYLQQF